MVLCLDDGPEGERALTTAVSLARANGGRLTVVCYGDALDEQAQDRESDIANRLNAVDITSRFVWVPPDARRALRAVLREAHGGALVVSAASDLAQSDILDSIIEDGACSLLLVR